MNPVRSRNGCKLKIIVLPKFPIAAWAPARTVIVTTKATIQRRALVWRGRRGTCDTTPISQPNRNFISSPLEIGLCSQILDRYPHNGVRLGITTTPGCETFSQKTGRLWDMLEQ